MMMIIIIIIIIIIAHEGRSSPHPTKSHMHSVHARFFVWNITEFGQQLEKFFLLK